jgi:dolichol-phosphate mannosyltransferase
MIDGKTVIFIPTYNERENVQELCARIHALNLDADILFLDDNSPDGTGEVLDGLAKKYQNVTVLHRTGKLGIGSAHQDGIQWAYRNKYKYLITMDCDFTHPPEHIPDLLKKAVDHDIVVGSRYLREDSLKGWNLLRKSLTMAGHVMTKYILKIQQDATGAFRLYDLEKVPSHAFQIVSSKGYSFFFESLYILNLNGFSIAEIPISLPPRTYGHSKMRLKDAWHSLMFLFAIYLNTLFNREKFEVYEPFTASGENACTAKDEQGWDAYWKSQKNSGGLIYDAIAAFYRKFIIKRSLNRFIRKYFKKGAEVLHAGCGSGQVDTDVHDYIAVTALDISGEALSIYKRVNKGCCRLLHGSIFDIRLPDASVDGIYNLGVMEHITEAEIKRILAEFRRILKPDGKIVLFWPPEFGLSVLFLKGVHYVLNTLLKKGVKLHPDEITRIRSKKHAEEMIAAAGFKTVEYYFGLRDAFTLAVIVGEKDTNKHDESCAMAAS